MALDASNITAPQPGMVVYARVRGNRKIRVGDEVGSWRPEIASIPDLSVLVSETYVEEIDIAKISVGDSVLITVDATPGEKFRGIILRMANVGQDLSGFESKVFAVTIELAESNKKLLPGMTSTNQIILERIPQQLTIPQKQSVCRRQSWICLPEKGWKNMETASGNRSRKR
jgi:HlyD family secretion protein